MSIRYLSLVLPAALVAAVGCTRPQKPATEVPPAPVVSRFTASKTRVAAGAAVRLDWKVENATTVTLLEASGGQVPAIAEDAFESGADVLVARSSVYILTARGTAGSDTRLVAVEVEGTTTSALFKALPTEIAGGETTTLIWSAPGAGTVSITDGSGVALPLGGQTESGSITVTPNKTTTYSFAGGGQTLSASVKVLPNLLTFAPSVGAAQPGQMVTLSWTTAGATKVTLSSPGRGELTSTTTAADVNAGSFTNTIPANIPANGVISYTLSVEGDGPTVSRPVTVYVSTGIAITGFVVSPLAKAGTVVPVSWTTVAADSVRLSVDGAVIYQSPTPAAAQTGSFTLTAPGSNFAVTLTATNSRGGVATRTVAVDVITPPTMATLTANPTSVTAGQKTTLTWSSPNARRVRIVASNGHTVGSALGIAAESGSVDAYPNENTTYTLTADDTLGDPPVTATAQVARTGNAATLNQTPNGTVLFGSTVSLSYDANPTAILYGLAHTAIQRATISNFVDIKSSGTRLQFGAAADDEVTQITPSFETFQNGRLLTPPVTISTNGWLAFGNYAAPLATESALPNGTAHKNLIAPFWDNLKFRGTSGIFWQVVGDAPEQRLIVQWDDMQIGSTTASSMTFQAQVHQTGAVSFHYADVTFGTSPYTSYEVGVQGNATTVGLRVPTPALVSNSAIYLFSPVATPAQTTVSQVISRDGFVKVGSGYLRVSAAGNAINLSDLLISEVMYAPSATVPAGEWVELENISQEAVSLLGWQLTTPDAGFTFDGGTIPPRGRLVVGQSADPAQNDDAGVGFQWPSGFALSDTSSQVRLSFAPDASVALSWTADGGTGTSLMFDRGPFLARGGPSTAAPITCSGTTPFGSQTPQQLGTPAERNTCTFGYVAQGIVGSYFDISLGDGGTVVAMPTGSTGAAVLVTLPTTSPDPAPVLFGAPQSVFTISEDGWLAVGNLTTTIAPTNKTVPTATLPLGTIAPFWDDLELRTRSLVLWKRVVANEDSANPGGHWIFQWKAFDHDLGVFANLNFQVKLFDTGIIEYHYGPMVRGFGGAYETGFSATVWLENPAGTLALPISVNTARSWAGTAVRFTPR